MENFQVNVLIIIKNHKIIQVQVDAKSSKIIAEILGKIGEKKVNEIEELWNSKKEGDNFMEDATNWKNLKEIITTKKSMAIPKNPKQLPMEYFNELLAIVEDLV